MSNHSRLNNPRRRQFFETAGAAIGAAALACALPAHADDLPHLATTDPTAQALGYTEDAAKVDAAKYPTHQAGQNCANCNFFHGASKGYGPCDLFPGKAANAAGWCGGYAKKA
jgi:High potential iron-sulfur protein